VASSNAPSCFSSSQNYRAFLYPSLQLASGPDYDYASGVTLHVYQLADGATATVTVPNLQGEPAATFAVERRGNEIRVERSGAPAAWRVAVDGGASIDVAAGVERCSVGVPA